jgi:hypothetical protein
MDIGSLSINMDMVNWNIKMGKFMKAYLTTTKFMDGVKKYIQTQTNILVIGIWICDMGMENL